MDVDPLEASVHVELAPELAFERFTAGFGAWWPAEFTWSQIGLLEWIGMDGRVDGLLSERGPHGFRVDWGRIVEWEPPTRLAFLWQIGADRVPVPDPARASTVTVTVEADADGSRVRVVHDAWQRHGDGAQDYRDQFQQAWPMALERFAAAP